MYKNIIYGLYSFYLNVTKVLYKEQVLFIITNLTNSAPTPGPGTPLTNEKIFLNIYKINIHISHLI